MTPFYTKSKSKNYPTILLMGDFCLLEGHGISFPSAARHSPSGKSHQLTGHGNGLDVVAAKLDLIFHIGGAHVLNAIGKFHPS